MKAFKPRTKLETGTRATRAGSTATTSSPRTHSGTGTWARSDLSNALQFDETVHAAYAVMSQGVGKFDLQGGLRAEYATRTFSLASPDDGIRTTTRACSRAASRRTT